MALAVGPFTLDQPIGQGAMGTVWAGHHPRTDRAVAVKVLKPPSHGAEAFLAAFRTEVRAVAGLDHPNVVVVLDHGIVREAEATRDETLVAGMPWLAMEYVPGGTLTRDRGRMPWPVLRMVLLGLLDALAHAHARGVVHRDLKPGNVLVGEHGIKLADFGLAHLSGSEGPEPAVLASSGTPTFMAPEQFDGRWRDFGPWTDLYALGALAWTMATAAPPFRAKDWSSARRMHLLEAVPRFLPTAPVAPGFEEWLRVLLEKDPAARFACAADAAFALRGLGAAEGGWADVTDAEDGDPELSTLVWDTAPALQPERPSAGGVVRTAAPMPASWRPRTPPRLRPRLFGAGLGLYGLRPIPMVDRDPERDLLWGALRAVHQGRTARAVVLRGPWGCGKSRLAQWLGERAAELGAAVPLRAVHAPDPGPGTGLEGLLERAFATTGLPRGEVHERIAARVARGGADPELTAGLTEFVRPATEAERAAGVPRVPFGSAKDRHRVLRRWIERLAAERPVVVWIDDAQWAADALAFAEGLVGRPAPVLVVATVRDDALVDRPTEAELLAALERREEVRSEGVGPLAAPDRPALVRGLLGLDGELARRVEERTAGNPLFAIHLVGDWVQRGLLEPGDRGFRLRAGAQVDLPDDVHRLWADRVEHVVRVCGPDGERAIEVGAVIGVDVDAEEWRLACDRVGVRDPGAALDELVAQRLAVTRGPEDWAFAHGMLRETVLRRASERLPGLHSVVADVLLGRRRPGVAERLARHLLAAGRDAEAIDPLLDAAQHQIRTGTVGTAERLLRDREAAMARVGVPPSDERMGRGRAQLALIPHLRGEVREARRLAREVRADAEVHGWKGVLGQVLFVESVAARMQGDLDEALALLGRAAAASAEARDPTGEARCQGQRGWTLLSLRRYEESEAAFRTAIGLYEELRDAWMIGVGNVGLGAVYMECGRLAEAEATFRHALAACEAAGSGIGAIDALLGLGETAHRAVRLDEAERWFAEAEARAEDAGLGTPLREARSGRAMVLMDRGRHAEAAAVLERVLEETDRAGTKFGTAGLRLALAECLAAEGRFDRAVEALERALAASDGPDERSARTAERIGALARAAGHARCEEAAQRLVDRGS